MDIVRSIQKIIDKNELIPEKKINVAVSGGADSVALLRILHLLDIDCTAVHVNHQLRGSASYDDQAFVENLSAELNIPLLIHNEDIITYAKKNNVSIEMAGREVRHNFFSTLLNKRVALGHHANDQAENFIIKSAMGSGLSGLGGMNYEQKVEQLVIVRPLLDYSHKEICEWLNKNNWSWREDESNKNNEFIRNRIRQKIIPTIKKELNADFIKTINRSMRLIREEDAYLDKLSSTFSIQTIKDAPLVIRRRWVRSWLHNNNIMRIGYKTTDQIAKGLKISDGSSFYNVNADYMVIIEYGLPKLVDINKENDKPNWKLDIEYGTGWRKDKNNCIGYLPAEASLSAEKVGNLGFKIRFIQDGDRFQPLGMKGHKKLQDIFTDKKIPKRDRSNIPIITCDETIVWIPGYSIANGWKVNGLKDSSVHLRLTIN